MSSPAVVLYDTADHVATITMNRPESLNAINQSVRDELQIAVTKAEADPAVRVIVIRGAGQKAFCAGADITEFDRPDSVLAARRTKQEANWIEVLGSAKKPTIAAIHGYCLGGGLEIALACDIRIAADDARLGLPEVTLAIIPGAGGTQRLSRTVGLAAALRLVLTGERIDAAEAHRIGLVSEIVPAGGLTDRSTALAATIASYAPQAVQFAKEAVRAGFDATFAAGLTLERDLAAVLAMTSDRLEAAAAFTERRPPQFRGE